MRRRLASSVAASRDASASHRTKSPSTCSASVGVKAARRSNPRASRPAARRRASTPIRVRSTSSAACTGPSLTRWRISSSVASSKPLADRPGAMNSTRSSSQRVRVSAASSRNTGTIAGCSLASRHSGIARWGPISSSPFEPTRTWLSPPRPVVWTSTAWIIVRQPPTRAPFTLSTGQPPLSAAMSVVVPPTSTVHTSRRPARCHAPTTLAAGPERTVSIGRRLAKSARTSDPSPLTTISGALIFRRARVACTAASSSARGAMRWALSATVVARRTALSWLVSS